MLEGKVAVVTGGSRGIGLEVARRLREGGARVCIVARDKERLRNAAAEIDALYFAADLTDPAEVERLSAEIAQAHDGRIPDILVNAAGSFVLAPIAETDPEVFDAVVGANLKGPFLMIRAFLPGMLERGSGDIVTLGSIAGRLAFPHNGAYSASKFGVRGLHAVLDAELRGTGVRSVLIEPAATDTSIWDAIDYERNPGLPPREAMLSPAAVADTVVYALTRPPEVAVRTLAVERA